MSKQRSSTDTCSASEQGTCSAQSDVESFPSTGASFHERRLSVKAVNDAPTITLLSTGPLTVDNGSCAFLSEMVFDDIDEFAMQGSSEMPMMTVQLKTTNGSLQLNQRTALDYNVRIRDQPMNTHQPVLLFANTSAVLDGSLSDLNGYLTTIQYCAFAGQNRSAIKPILAQNDVLVVELSDNGFCGETDSTSLSTTATLSIEIISVVGLGQVSVSADPVTLVNHSVPLNLQYMPGNVAQLDVDLQFDHDDGTLIGIDGQFGPLLDHESASRSVYVPYQLTLDRLRDSEDCGLAIWTTENTNALLSFKLSRSVCRRVDDCRLLQSPDLSFRSTDEMIMQSAKGLALDSESTDHVNVLRFDSSGNYLHIVNLPRSFVLDVQILTQAEGIAWQVLCPHIHLQGTADQIGLGLKNATLYTLGGPRRINRLSVSVQSTQDEASDAEISIAVNVDIQANYEQIHFTMPRDIVLDNEHVKWLSSVSISDSSSRWTDPKYDCNDCRVPTRAFWLSIETDHAQVRVGVHLSAMATRVRSFGRALDLQGKSVSDFNDVMKSVYIDANPLLRDPSKLTLYIKNQTFHVRAMTQKTTSVQVLNTSTSVADGAVGTVQFSLTLPTGYYDILKARASQVICTSISIDVTGTTDAIADQITTMPCSPPFDTSMLFRREIQAIRVEALDPFIFNELSGSFEIMFNGQTTNSIPIGSSSAALKQILSSVIADPAIEVSSLALNGEKAFEWLVTFGEMKDQQNQLQGIVSANGMPSFSVTTSIVQQGFGASNILLNRFIPGLAISVRALTAQEAPSYALVFSFLNVSRDFPILVVSDNSLLSATTNDALDVDVYSVNQEKSANNDFQLRINQNTTALIAANASGLELERAIFALGIRHLSLSVQRHALNGGENLFEWIIVASYPTVLDIAILRTKQQERATLQYEVSCQDHGIEVLAAFDTVQFSLSLSDANTTLAKGSVPVRIEKRIERGATMDFGFSYFAVRQNESVEFGDMIVRGMERNLTLVISALQGLVSLIPRRSLNSLNSQIPIRAAQSMAVLEGSAAEINDALQFHRLIYSSNPDAFGFDRVVFALNWRDDEMNTSIPIQIIASVIAPALQIPAETIHVFQDEEILIPGLKLIEKALVSTTNDLPYFVPEIKIVRVQIQSMNGGVLALNQAMQTFFSYSEKQRQWKNALELSGSFDQVNLALTGVRYNATTLDNDLDFDWLQFSTLVLDNETWSIPKKYRLNITIAARPIEVQILMNGRVISMWCFPSVCC